MENSVFVELNCNELLEYDGGLQWAIKFVDFFGFVEAAKDFTTGFAAGFSDAWK